MSFSPLAGVGPDQLSSCPARVRRQLRVARARPVRRKLLAARFPTRPSDLRLDSRVNGHPPPTARKRPNQCHRRRRDGVAPAAVTFAAHPGCGCITGTRQVAQRPVAPHRRHGLREWLCYRRSIAAEAASSGSIKKEAATDVKTEAAHQRSDHAEQATACERHREGRRGGRQGNAIALGHLISSRP